MSGQNHMERGNDFASVILSSHDSVFLVSGQSAQGAETLLNSVTERVLPKFGCGFAALRYIARQLIQEP